MKTYATNHRFFVFTLITILIVLSVQRDSYGQNLNVGEPRTVRLLYFLPNDRPYRPAVVQEMRDMVRTVQTFFAEQMQAHGYGKKTFRFETNGKGEPRVRRVDGKHPFRHYDNTLGTAVIKELEQAFDFEANIYFIVLGADALRQGNGQPAGGVASKRGKNGGHVVVPNRFGWTTVAHELGHTFGLGHDFRDNSYIMSYGHGQDASLSAAAAEFLSVSPFFNPRIPTAPMSPPTVVLISSSTYAAGSKSIPVRLKVKDSSGLHQIQLFAWGGLQKSRGLARKTESVVEFEYDGGIGLLDFDANSIDFVSLSEVAGHDINVMVIDTAGNSSYTLFRLHEKSDFLRATLEASASEIRSLAFSPDGQILASGGRAGEIKLWDVITERNITTITHDKGFPNPVWVSFLPDGQTLASVSRDVVQFWDVVTERNIANLDFFTGSTSPYAINSVSFSSDGKTLASVKDGGEVQFWDVITGRNIATIALEEEFSGPTWSASFSPDGKTFAATSASVPEVQLWDITGSKLATFPIPEQGVSDNCLSFSPDRAILAFGSAIGEIQLWDLTTRRSIATLFNTAESDGGVFALSFSPDGTILASAYWRNKIKLWDVTTGSELATFLSPNFDSYELFLSFSPDGKTLASAGLNGEVRLWAIPSVDDRRKITISEIMVASNDGSLPQWVELHNPSNTHSVNLKGWRLEIQNRRSTNFNGRINTAFTFKKKIIKPQETLLLVSKQGRSSNNFQKEQIYDLNTLHPNLQDIVLSKEGFYLKLSNVAGELIDEVGNLDGRRNTGDKPVWSLPRNLTEDGVRASMIRRHDDEVPQLGADASGWISAINTKLLTGTTTYYGHPDDIGAPGIESGGALPVALSRFRAELTDAGVVLRWITESELDNAGFNILRSETKDGEFKVVNPKLIQGAGTTSERQTYTWTDTTAKPNVVYYYRIEDISHAGDRKQLATVRMRGYVSAVGKLTTKWGDLKLQE
ncbi:hypothetical protein F4Z99_00155 [Candidatus Poribacteria bacterium]|nr:hypothetical protein [Candidatus Poribacteria bacterium]